MNRNWLAYAPSLAAGLVVPIVWRLLCSSAEIPDSVTRYVMSFALLGGLLVFFGVAFYQARRRSIGRHFKKATFFVSVVMPAIFFFVADDDSSARLTNGAPPGEHAQDDATSGNGSGATAVRRDLPPEDVKLWLDRCYFTSIGWDAKPQTGDARWSLDRISGYYLPTLSTALLDAHERIACRVQVTGHKSMTLGVNTRHQRVAMLGMNKFIEVVDERGHKHDLNFHLPTDITAEDLGSVFWLRYYSKELSDGSWELPDGDVGMSLRVSVTANIPDDVRLRRLVLEKQFTEDELGYRVPVCKLPTAVTTANGQSEVPVTYDVYVGFYPALIPGTRVLDAPMDPKDVLSPGLSPEHLHERTAPRVILHDAAGQRIYQRSVAGTGSFVKTVQELKDYVPNWDGGGQLSVVVPRYDPDGHPVLVTCRVVLRVRRAAEAAG